MNTTRIVFMGSPDFALPSLQALADNYPVVGVVTQPDRRAGRGRALTSPPVKILAEKLGLPLLQPPRLKAPDAFEQLQAWTPEIIVVAAFGQILRPAVLELPPLGCINVHASLLPHLRGAAPIQAALLNGDLKTGVTIMRMDQGVDTGPILSQRALDIKPDDTAQTLSARLAQLGAELLIETLPAYISGAIEPQPQDDTKASYAPLLEKEAGRLDFSEPAAALARRVRAYNPWPGAFTFRAGQRLKVLQAHAAPARTGEFYEAGQETLVDGLPAAAAAPGLLVLDEVQPAGKRPMPGETFLNGVQDWGTQRLG